MVDLKIFNFKKMFNFAYSVIHYVWDITHNNENIWQKFVGQKLHIHVVSFGRWSASRISNWWKCLWAVSKVSEGALAKDTSDLCGLFPILTVTVHFLQ